MLSVVTSFETRTSSLYILTPCNWRRARLAIARLSHYVPAGFHGTWRAGAAGQGPSG